jgi:glycosyltransferase involved in cell wall biosynthesis
MPRVREGAPWLIVSGGFHRHGAMDLANLALATYLLSEGRDVHLVSHEIDPALVSQRGVHAHVVKRLGSVAVGELMLERTAVRLSVALRRVHPDLRVVANGGNFPAADVNWVHSVHHAWPIAASAGPLARRVKRRIESRLFKRREARAFRHARLLIANSALTRTDLVERLRVDPARVHVIAPGADPSWRPPNDEQRRDARVQFGITGTAVLFVGALGADDNKGLGRILDAWGALCADPGWDATLLLCGAGSLTTRWRRVVHREGLDGRVRFLGFVSEAGRVLNGSDLLVSASRYESYGMAIAEALCRGVPAIMPATAGIAASLSREYEPLLIKDSGSTERVIGAFRAWAADPSRWKAVAANEGARLRQFTTEDMAAAIVRAVER